LDHQHCRKSQLNAADAASTAITDLLLNREDNDHGFKSRHICVLDL
jgi:hypothetical protein